MRRFKFEQYTIDINDTIRTGLISESVIFKCGICRADLTSYCLDHRHYPLSIFPLNIHSLKNLIQTHKKWLVHFRNSSIKTKLHILPKDIVNYIQKLIPINGSVLMTCPVVKGSCKHVYHRCCIDKWLRRKKYCPLDNTTWLTTETDEISEVLMIESTLVCM